MGYATAVVSGVRRWRPTLGDMGRAVLMVGHSVGDWLAPATTGQPRAVTTEGWWAWCIDTGGDLDATLDLAADQVDVTSVAVVAHGAGCQTVLDWAIEHPHRVASLSLQAPDVTLSAQRRYVLRDVLGSTSPGGTRIQVWHETGDSDAAQLAADLGATVYTLTDPDPTAVDPAPIVAQLLARAGSWDQQPAAAQMARWVDYVRSDPTFIDPGHYRGGDASISVPLPDGRIAWWFADSSNDRIDLADWTFDVGAGLVNNSLVIDDGGAFVGQHYASGTTGPAIVPPEPDTWYWPLDGTIVGGQIRLLCSHLEASGGPFPTTLDRRILTIDPDDFSVIATTSGIAAFFSADEIFFDNDRVYIYGLDPGGDRTLLARAPAGTLTDLGTWQVWDGDNWSDDPDAAAPIEDTSGVPLAHGGAGTTRRTRAGFLRAVKALFTPEMRIYRSGWPQGPWEPYQTISTPDTGSERYGGSVYSYAPHWHPQLDVSPTELAVSWNSNLADTTGSFFDHDFVWARPHFEIVHI
jgi:hypothetical protein